MHWLRQDSRLRIAKCLNRVAFLLVCSTSASRLQGQTTVFHGGVLIDGTGSPPLRDAVIVVKDSIIACVGTRAHCSSYGEGNGIKRVDVSGNWIIPGLIDMHVHLTNPAGGGEQDIPALLKAGVTTVQDVGAWPDTAQSRTTYGFGYGQVERMAALVERVGRGSPPGPRIRYCGPGLYSSDNRNPPRFPVPFIRLRSDGDVEEVVRYLVNRGASCIKLFSNTLPRHMEEALASAAAHGVRGIGHSTLNVPLEAQLAWAWAEIHHEWFPAEDILPPARRAQLPENLWARLFVAWARFDPTAPEAAALAAKVAQRRIAWVPTLASMRELSASDFGLIRGAGPGDSTLVREALFDPARPPASAADSAEALSRAASRFAMHWVRLLHGAGATILAGCDCPSPGRVLGAGLHQELEYLVDAGLSPMEALVAATRNAAAALRLSDRLGTVSAGKLADFVVLRADPLQHIRNTRTIRLVVFGGAIIEIEPHGG